MAKRKNEIDVKLLLYAIQKTSNFESLLTRRFTGVTIEEDKNLIPKETNKEETKQDEPMSESELLKNSPFNGIIGQCFIPYLNIYIESVDRNLADLIERYFVPCIFCCIA